MSRLLFIAVVSVLTVFVTVAACNFGDAPELDEGELMCIADGECDGDDAYCVDEVCVECGSDSHCDDGVCYQEDNTCQSCVESEDCAGDDVCVDFECVECDSASHCDDGVCHDNQCVECTEAAHCSGDDICSDHECVSGCEDFDCGGGECVDDGGSISCECDEGFVKGEDGTCDSCICEIENGTGQCDGGVCQIESCDPGYETEDDDPDTGCECGPEDTPDPVNFTDGNCDGLDGDMSRAIFVSEFGDDDDDGRPLRPVRSIGQGIELAAEDAERDSVFIAEGTYEETIELEDSVSLYGGYRDQGDGTWDRGPNYETIISGEGEEGGNRPLVVSGVSSDIDIQLLTIVADDPSFDDFYFPPPGDNQLSHAGTSVGMVVNNNSGHINISYVDIEVGNGRDGSDGDDGDEGPEGEDGDDATDVDGALDNPSTDPEDFTCPFGADRDAPGRAGGHGGVGRPSDCGSECTAAADGGTINYPGTTPNINGGDAGEHYDFGQCGDHDFQAGSNGGVGDDGHPADETEDPDPISSGAELLVDFNLKLVYLGATGPDGDHGDAGGSAGGGGGGGGSYTGICAILSGGGGGAGGLGGCGGEGGKGGEAGGGSVGILIHSSTVTVADSFIDTGRGGDGGAGGAGGEGGDGGSGGDGADGEEAPDPTNGDDAADGGAGGDGMPGARGGHGGGGEGGPSVGIIHADSAVTTEELEFDLGSGGRGGDGGGDPDEGDTGPEGPDGLEDQVVEL